jgi:hypothetical protein
MKEKMTEQERAKQFQSLMEELAGVMIKHGIDNLVAIYGLNGELRNTYIPLKGEVGLYCKISDAFDEWLKQDIVKEYIKGNQ